MAKRTGREWIVCVRTRVRPLGLVVSEDDTRLDRSTLRLATAASKPMCFSSIVLFAALPKRPLSRERDRRRAISRRSFSARVVSSTRRLLPRGPPSAPRCPRAHCRSKAKVRAEGERPRRCVSALSPPCDPSRELNSCASSPLASARDDGPRRVCCRGLVRALCSLAACGSEASSSAVLAQHHRSFTLVWLGAHSSSQSPLEELREHPRAP